MTYGQQLVGLNLNPLYNTRAQKAKVLYGQIIDLCVEARDYDIAQGLSSDDHLRMFEIAINEAQTGCMWTVQAILFNEDK